MLVQALVAPRAIIRQEDARKPFRLRSCLLRARRGCYRSERPRAASIQSTLAAPSGSIRPRDGAGTDDEAMRSMATTPHWGIVMTRDNQEALAQADRRLIVRSAVSRVELELPAYPSSEQQDYMRNVPQSTGPYDPSVRVRGARPRVA